MAASFTMTRNQIIEKAFRRIQVLGEGEVLTSDMYNSAADDLNLINEGLNKFKKKLWAIEEGFAKLSLPDSVTHNDVVYYCIVPHTSSSETEPGVGENWDIYWYAADINPSETPDAWVTATAYTNGGEINLPEGAISIESAFLRDDNDDVPVSIINRFEENAIFTKWETGEPACLRFDRYATIPKVTLYFLPGQTGYTLFYTYLRRLTPVTAQGDTPDVPSEWYDYLIYELAAKQGEEFGVKESKIIRMTQRAQVELRLNLRDQKEDSDPSCVAPCYDD